MLTKQAAEKIAQEYYDLGVQLALQGLGEREFSKIASQGLVGSSELGSRIAKMLGLVKEAPQVSRSKQIAKMLGLAGAGAGAGVGAGALGMRYMTPEISSAVAKMTPSELGALAKNVGAERLAKADEVTQQIVKNLGPKQMEPGFMDSLSNLDIYERLAMGGQALKGMFTDPRNTFEAAKLIGKDGLRGLQMTDEVLNSPVKEVVRGAAERLNEAKPLVLDHL